MRGRRSLFGGDKGKRKPKIEIIPMVDVMFLLLVFYILSTIALTVGFGIPVALPEASSGETALVEETVVTITAGGEVYLNKEQVQLSGLGQALLLKAGEMDGGIEALREGYVVLNVDMDVPHRSVVQAMNQLREVGISNFSIATEQEGS